MIQYFDDRGWCYRVMPGIGLKTFKGRYCKPGKDCFHCIAALPWRDSQEQAEADLAAYAAKKGWRRVES